MSESNPYRIADAEQAKTMAERQSAFLVFLAHERGRQDQKWGKNVVDLDRMIVVMGEEFGEVCRGLLERDRENLEVELVQLAAVCSKLFEILGVTPSLEPKR